MRLFLSSLQWAAFIFVSAMVVPIVIGHAFGLPPVEIAAFLQRTIFIMGCAALLQVLFGHRLPIAEGPAGLWWGTFTIYAGLAASGALSTEHALRQLEATMLLSGLFFLIIGAFRLVQPIKKLFSPLVTGTFLILLVAQLSSSFVKGLLGIGYLSNAVDPRVAIPAAGILIITILLSRSRHTMIRSYSILISFMLGWLLFYLLGLTKPMEKQASQLSFPKPFAFGAPEFTSGTVATAIMLTMLLLTNMLASIHVVERIVKNGKKKRYENRASLIAGLNQGLSGLFAGVAPVPLSATAGFLLTTKTMKRLPFIIANLILIAMSFFPAAASFFATVPAPVGYAVMFIAIGSLAALGIQEYRSLQLTEQQLFAISLSLMIGIGSLFVPPEAIANLPNLFMLLANNGLILGTLACICIEQLFRLFSRKNKTLLKRDETTYSRYRNDRTNTSAGEEDSHLD